MTTPKLVLTALTVAALVGATPAVATAAGYLNHNEVLTTTRS